MAKIVAVLMIAICSLILFSSCGQAGLVTKTNPQSPLPSANPSPTATTVTSELVFSPGDVLAGLPIYPNATPTTSDDPFYGQPAVSFSQPAYTGNLIPETMSASAQYIVRALGQDILSWYSSELRAKGYRELVRSVGGVGCCSITFFLPSQPLFIIEIHDHPVLNAVHSTTVFDLLVIYHVPPPKPPEEILPDDIESITATYFSGGEPIVKTLTDNQVVMQLVGMVNALPVRSDYIHSCPTGGPQTIFSLVFHSRSRGDITVTDILGCGELGIHIDDYPILEDNYQLFREAVEQILGVQVTYPANNEALGNKEAKGSLTQALSRTICNFLSC